MSTSTPGPSASPQAGLIVEQIEMGPMKNFVYVVGCAASRQVVLIDPAWDIDGLLEHVRTRGYEPVGSLVTHYHPDHCGGSLMGHRIEGVAHLLARESFKVHVNKHEAAGLKKVTGLSDSDLVAVDSGDKLTVGDVEIEFLHTPGHTPGSQCFRIHNTLVSGDTLFIQGCGRVDLPGSDPDQMYESLNKLASLPDDTLLLPGHNYSDVPRATLGETKRVNFHLKVPTIELWRQMMGAG